jgi:thiol-disulfide isomerase/thioredoxin
MRYTTLLFSLLFVCCSNPDTVIIKGDVKNLPGKYVYLSRSAAWDHLTDSTLIDHGKFEFRLSAKTLGPGNTNVLVRNAGKLHTLCFANRENPKEEGFCALFPGVGETVITGDFNQNLLELKYGQETKFLFNISTRYFGNLARDSASNKVLITRYKKTIRDFPNSYFLFSRLYQQREQYSNQQLKDLSAMFSQEVRDGKVGTMLNEFVSQRPDAPYVKDFKFWSVDHQKVSVLDTNAKANLIVFWASWCGPCRAEIPVLKRLYNNTRDKGLHMASISIDEKESMWKDMLAVEIPEWQQVRVDSAQLAEIKAFYNFSAIPLLILADNKGNIIKRLLGYEEQNDKIIYDLLNK